MGLCRLPVESILIIPLASAMLLEQERRKIDFGIRPSIRKDSKIAKLAINKVAPQMIPDHYSSSMILKFKNNYMFLRLSGLLVAVTSVATSKKIEPLFLSLKASRTKV